MARLDRSWKQPIVTYGGALSEMKLPLEMSVHYYCISFGVECLAYKIGDIV